MSHERGGFHQYRVQKPNLQLRAAPCFCVSCTVVSFSGMSLTRGLPNSHPYRWAFTVGGVKLKQPSVGRTWKSQDPRSYPTHHTSCFQVTDQSGAVSQGNSHSDQGFVNWLPKLNNILRLLVLVLSSLLPGHGVLSLLYISKHAELATTVFQGKGETLLTNGHS